MISINLHKLYVFFAYFTSILFIYNSDTFYCLILIFFSSSIFFRFQMELNRQIEQKGQKKKIDKVMKKIGLIVLKQIENKKYERECVFL